MLQNYEKPKAPDVVKEPPLNKPQPRVEPKAKPVSQSKVKTLSIKDAIEGKINPPQIVTNEDPVDENVGEDVDIVDPTEEQVPFTQVELEKVWQKFIDAYLSDKPRYASVLQNYEPLVNANNLVVLDLDSQLQVDMLKEIKNDLVAYLKKNLENKNLTLDLRLQPPGEQKNKLYTVEDKFKYLSEINPEIIRLKQQLNLDFD